MTRVIRTDDEIPAPQSIDQRISTLERTIRKNTYVGPTSERPNASVGAGFQFYDTTLSKPIWSDGTTWRDAAGTAV